MPPATSVADLPTSEAITQMPADQLSLGSSPWDDMDLFNTLDWNFEADLYSFTPNLPFDPQIRKF